MTFEELRSLGLNLIPCHARSKQPKVKWLDYKIKQYTGDLGNDNAAVMCGVTSGNLVVIDIDRPGLETKYFSNWDGVLSSTLVVRTGKGGVHVYCHPKGQMIPVIKMIDSNGLPVGEIRGQGGYVLAPGSIHDTTGNTYEIISSTKNIESIDIDQLLTKLKDNGIVPQNQLPPIRELVKSVPLGNRNNAAFKYAAHLIGTVGLTDYETVLFEIKRWANDLGFTPTKPNELENVVRSALSKVRPPSIAEINKALEFPNLKKLREVSSKDEGKIISFDALIIGMDEYRTVTTNMLTICPNCLKERNIISDGYVNPKLPKCDKCKVALQEKSIQQTTDMRQIILQELPEECTDNNPMNRTARVIGNDAFTVNFGERVRVSGKFKSFTETGKKDNQVAILITHFQCLDEPEELEFTPDELEKIRLEVNDDFIKDKLIPSFAPGLFGLEVQKEILLLTLAGGCNVGGIRPDINTFIVGNPSGGKSELLKFFDKIATKCSIVNAATSSAAGLVYGMVKLSDGTSVPQAGPIVLNDGGFCCIDELDKARDGVYSSLLQAMEQQIVSFSRSGVNKTANARTAIIAAANPEGGKWDKTMTFMENIKIPQPLASRFDWITGIIKSNNIQRGMIADHVFSKSITPLTPYFTEVQLKKYFNHVKNIEPKISIEAQKKLREFYMKISVKLEEEGIPFEVRQLEGLQRASFARAKILMKSEVSVGDVDVIIELYKKSLESLYLEVSDTMVQSQFEDSSSKKKSKEKTLRDVFISLEDETRLVDKTELFKKLMSEHPEQFADAYECDDFFKKYEGSRFLIDGNTGKYKFRL